MVPPGRRIGVDGRAAGRRPKTKEDRDAMKSKAKTVDKYLAQAPEERRPALGVLRGLCLDELAGYEEAMRYGMPCYSRDGVVEVSFASQKGYVSFYVLKQGALEANAHLLEGLPVGKSCIRYRRPEQIDPEVVRALLTATVADTGLVC